VTYNSAEDIGPLVESIAGEARDLDLAVLIADNASADDTLERARRASSAVTAFGTGGNLGYSGAINAALARLDRERPVLILNPDAIVAPGAFRIMLDALDDPRVGAVVPRILDADGELSYSQRREPSVSRALGDALLGAHAQGRPGAFSEIVYERDAYGRPGDVDWATGAAVLLSRAAVREVGPWDERFFLYSEETDYLRRVRAAGYAVRYIPDAVVQHRQGGSGSSPRLVALSAVNRVRYMRKHRSRGYAAAFRGAAVLAELLRRHRPENAEALRFLTRESRWAELPGGER
jgi:GT2 family glycosyltransferase